MRCWSARRVKSDHHVQTGQTLPARLRPAQCSSQPGASHTPLLDAVMERGQRRGEVPLHVPGHKRGAGVLPKLRDLAQSGDMLHCDLTELPGLDYLASPTGVIAQAQAAAAAAFGAEQTWFLVNGCSVAIHAAVLAVAGPGDTLLLARNCHQAAYAAVTLAGCHPFWLYPELDPDFDLAHGVSPASLSQGLQRARAAGCRVAGVLLVSPTYFGAALHIRELAAVCHEAGIPLLVDEAHGGHFGLLPDPQVAAGEAAGGAGGAVAAGAPGPLPPSALSQGADLVMHSTHKALSALTQAAMLHAQGGRVDRGRVSRALQMLQTSSPSYLLLASLDAARALAQQPQACFATAMQAAQIARSGIADLPPLQLLDIARSPCCSHLPPPKLASVHCFDPLRLAVRVSGLGQGVTGFQVSQQLEEEYGVVAELATSQVVLFVLGPGSQPDHAVALVVALRDIVTKLRGASSGRGPDIEATAASTIPLPLAAAAPAQPARLTSPRDAFFTDNVRLPADECVGRASAELLCPYPPGVPLVYPGELITREALDTLRGVKASGGTVTGLADSSLDTLAVLDL